MTAAPATAGKNEARRAVLLIFAMPLILAVLYYSWLAIAVTRTRYTWQQMDWNGDGHTTIGEFFRTADVIERPIMKDGRSCTELVWSREGTSIRVECPSP